MSVLTEFLLNAGLPSIESVAVKNGDGNETNYKYIEIYTTQRRVKTRDPNGMTGVRLQDNYWTVEDGWGPEGGYGALCYLIAMQICGSLASDEDATTSGSAQDLWKRFYNDPRIAHEPIEERRVGWSRGMDHHTRAVKYRYWIKTPFFTQQQIDDAIARYKEWSE
jgi:hypothetical protein